MSDPVFDKNFRQVGTTESIVAGKGSIYDGSGNTIGQYFPGEDGGYHEPLYDRFGNQIGVFVPGGMGFSPIESMGCNLILLGLAGTLLMGFSIPLLFFSLLRKAKGLNHPTKKSNVGCWFWVLMCVAPMSAATGYLAYDEYKRRGVLTSTERKVCQWVIGVIWALLGMYVFFSIVAGIISSIAGR